MKKQFLMMHLRGPALVSTEKERVRKEEDFSAFLDGRMWPKKLVRKDHCYVHGDDTSVGATRFLGTRIPNSIRTLLASKFAIRLFALDEDCEASKSGARFDKALP